VRTDSGCGLCDCDVLLTEAVQEESAEYSLGSQPLAYGAGDNSAVGMATDSVRLYPLCSARMRAHKEVPEWKAYFSQLQTQPPL
jgi:hypothetical protein